MLSVLRPAAATTRTFGSRFFVDENLQTKKRRRAAQQGTVAPPPTCTAPTPAPTEASTSANAGVGAVRTAAQHPFQQYAKNLIDYFRLLETNLIGDFLRCDKCFKVSDSYALSMVFIYFIRAEFAQAEYTKENFFIALYLALDMEDDLDDFKFELFPWCLGKEWKRTYPMFLQRRDQLWRRMDYRALCSKTICDEIMRIMPSPYWNRVRKENHGGAVRKYRQPAHPNNDMPVGPFGTPVPCFHCYLAKAEEEEEEERWAFIKEDPSSSSPSRSKSGDDSDIFVTADESLSNNSQDIEQLFGAMKREEDSSFLDLSSSGYREGSAFGDVGENDEDEFWAAVTSVNDDDLGGEDIFATSSDEEKVGSNEGEKGSREASKDDQNGYLSDLFSNSSDDDLAVGRNNGPSRAHRSFSRINLRDKDAPAKRPSPDVFLKED